MRIEALKIFAIAALALLSLVSPADAGSLTRWDFAGSDCNHDGLSANGAAGLGNWSSSSKKAYCGFSGEMGIGRTLDFWAVGVKGGVTCKLKRLSYWGHTGTTFSPNDVTSSEVLFTTDRSDMGLFRWAAQCDVPKGGGRISGYTVFTK